MCSPAPSVTRAPIAAPAAWERGPGLRNVGCVAQVPEQTHRPDGTDGGDAAELLRRQRAEADRQLAIVLGVLSDVVESAGSTTGDDEHDPEGSTIAFERAQAIALAQQARARIAELDAAESRLREGGYGICLACGRPIAPERLAARPTADKCIRCASAR
jgi:DnaK suppressor protein